MYSYQGRGGSHGYHQQQGQYFLSFEDFSGWFSSPEEDPLKVLMARAFAAYSACKLPRPRPGEVNLQRTNSRTDLHLNNCYSDEKIATFNTQCLRCLGLDDFILLELLTSSPMLLTKATAASTLRSLNKAAAKAPDYVIDAVLDMLGLIDNSESCSFSRFAALWFFISGDNKLSLAQVAFRRVTQDESGFVHEMILYFYLVQAFSCVFYFNHDLRHAVGVDSEDLALAVHLAMLNGADRGRWQAGKLTFVEFIDLLAQGIRLGLKMLHVSGGLAISSTWCSVGASGCRPLAATPTPQLRLWALTGR